MGRGAVVPVDVAEPEWEQRGALEILVPSLKLVTVELVRRQPVERVVEAELVLQLVELETFGEAEVQHCSARCR